MRRALLLLVSVLVVAPPAEAKGPVTVSICGSSGCEIAGTGPAHSATSRGIASAVLNWTELEPASMPPPGAFYALELRAGWLEDPQQLLYVRDAGVVAAARTLWLDLPRPLAARLRQATRRIRPWPWLGLRSVRVGGRNVPEPAPYVQLFHPLPKAESPPYDAERIAILVEPHALEHPRYPAAPWSSERVKLEWYPAQNVLYREGEWLRVPAALAARLEQDAGRARPADTPEPAQVPWALVAGGVAACALAVAVGLLAAWRVSRRVGGLLR